jgi:hypothetical protein
VCFPSFLNKCSCHCVVAPVLLYRYCRCY